MGDQARRIGSVQRGFRECSRTGQIANHQLESGFHVINRALKNDLLLLCRKRARYLQVFSRLKAESTAGFKASYGEMEGAQGGSITHRGG